MLFREMAFLFAKFLNCLGSLKIKNSGYPPEVNTEEDKIKYCQDINEQMHFNEDFLKLKPQDITFNSIQRSITKEALNRKLFQFLKIRFKIYINFLIN